MHAQLQIGAEWSVLLPQLDDAQPLKQARRQMHERDILGRQAVHHQSAPSHRRRLSNIVD